MLRFTRNKWVSIHRKDKETLNIHGVLDDDIYGLEINLTIGISSLEILAISGKWNRWTTPECPRAIPLLQEAVGLKIEEEGFSQTVQRIVGRKSCRHHANILLECCHAARQAALIAKWEDRRSTSPHLTFEAFLNGQSMALPASDEGHDQEITPSSERKKGTDHQNAEERAPRGAIIDLHVHTSPASPCSSAPVDEVIEEAKRIGLDGICLTEHNVLWNSDTVSELRQKHGFLVLRGNEITTDQGDVLVFGLQRDIKGIIKLGDLREEVLKAHGFMIVAHPFRGFLTFGVGQLGLTPEKAMERSLFKQVDAIEVMNGKVTEKENTFASEVAAGLGMPKTGGSDAHEVSEVGLYATQFSETIRNEKDLIEALRNGRYSPIAYRRQRRLI